MLASWNSNSKSDTARIPRKTTCALCCRILSISNELNPMTSIRSFLSAKTCATVSVTCAKRSCGEKRVFFPILEATPTIR